MSKERVSKLNLLICHNRAVWILPLPMIKWVPICCAGSIQGKNMP